MPFVRSAGAVIFRKGNGGTVRYLLLQQSKTYWNFPKGKLEKGETDLEAARREIREETGLKAIKIIPGFKAADRYIFRAPKEWNKESMGGKTVFKTVVFYLAQVKTKKVKISFEHLGYAWLTYGAAAERLKKYKQLRRILEDANRFLSKRHQRA